MGESSFICAICEREPDDRWACDGRDRHVAPLCRFCERWWAEGRGAPKAGAFMDRRKVMQIAALAEALRTDAAHIKQGYRHVRA